MISRRFFLKWLVVNTGAIFSPRVGYSVSAGEKITYYIDTVNGDNLNSGSTPATAFKTLKAAHDAYKASGENVVVFAIHAPENNPVNVETLDGQEGYLELDTGHVTLRGVDDLHWYMSVMVSRYTGGWSANDMVFHQTVATTAIRVFVEGLTDENGLTLELYQNLTTPTEPALGEWGLVDYKEMYLRLPNDLNPNDYTIVYSRRNEGLKWSGESLTLNRCVFQYCRGSGFELSGGTALLNDCEFNYCNVGLVSTENHGSATINNCRAFGNLNDGFNHNYGTWILNECEASYNGDEGVSPHMTATMIIQGGLFRGNGGKATNGNFGAGFTAANDAIAHIDGATFDANESHGVVFGSNSSGSMQNCTLSNNQGKGFVCATSGRVALANNTMSENAEDSDQSCN